jgi:sulfate permease, SulP family
VPNRLEPKIIQVFREGYTKERLIADITAGVIVGIVALPLAIAFAIASGVKPEQGLFTAVIAGLIVSGMGGSRVQIAGPTGAFIVIVYGIVQQYGYDGLVIATIMAGMMMIGMGFFRFGTLLKFVPYPLTVGFTSGIALIIFSSQVNDFLGLRIRGLPAEFVEKWIVYGDHIVDLDTNALVVGGFALVTILTAERFVKRIPGSLIALLGATAIVHGFGLEVETIGSRFGEVPNSLPAPSFPDITWGRVTELFSPALTIAMLGAIESLLSAVVADGMIGSRHRSNVELIAQGVANVVAPIFSGIPATGAIARTATNVRNGGRSPIAGMVHSVTLLLIMLFFGAWATLIPMPALAAILIVVSYNMCEWRSFVKVMRAPRSDVAVMLVTFGLTVLIDLTIAIQVGVILSAMLFIRRMAEVSQIHLVDWDSDEDDAELVDIETRAIQSAPGGINVFTLKGSLFFGLVDRFADTVRSRDQRVLILEMHDLLAIDASGIRAVENLKHELDGRGTHLLLAGVQTQPMFALTQAGLVDAIGEDLMFASLPEALYRAQELAGVEAAG